MLLSITYTSSEVAKTLLGTKGCSSSAWTGPASEDGTPSEAEAYRTSVRGTVDTIQGPVPYWIGLTRLDAAHFRTERYHNAQLANLLSLSTH